LKLLEDTPENALISRESGVADNNKTYLHQCLGVISGPLLESPPFRKAAKSWEGWDSCNAKISLSEVVAIY
jgi:hypothetical protein